MADALAFERPRHRHLVKADADLGGMGLVDPQIVQGLAHVEIGFAGGDDAKARIRAVDDDAVEPIGPGKGEGGVELVFVQPVFLVERLVGPADIEPARRHLEILGQHDPGSRRSDIDRGRAVDGFGDGLEGDPAAGIARHRPAIQAEIEDFLHPRRVEHRDAGVHEGVFGLMRQGRGFAGVVVAGEQQHPAMRRRAGGIAVLQRVAAAVDPRSLGVPHGKDAIVFGAGEQTELLAAPYRGGRELFVDRRLKADVVVFDKAARAPQRLVEPAQRRTAIARNKAAGIEPGGDIALALHHRQTHQRLGPGQIDATLVETVFIVERDCLERHRHLQNPPL